MASRTSKSSGRPSTARRDKRIIALYESGKSCAAVGEIVGLTWSGVNVILKRHGVPIKPFGWYPARTPASYLRAREIVKKVAHLYDTGPGTSALDLGRMTGLNAHTIRRHLVALGVKMRIAAGMKNSLTIPEVRRIKADLIRGEDTFETLTDRYGVAKAVITSIAMERSWAHVPWPKGARYVRRSHGRPKKLTEETVRQIKADLQITALSYSVLSRRYKVAASSLSGIARGLTWTRVPWPDERGYTRRGKPWKILLNPEKVREIKVHLCGDEFTHAQIGEKFGVSESVINHIASRNTWKDVPWPTKLGYTGRPAGFRSRSSRMAGHVLDIEGRRREERRKGERVWEESRGKVGRG